MNSTGKLKISVTFTKSLMKGDFNLTYKDIEDLDSIDTDTYPKYLISNIESYTKFIKECNLMVSIMSEALKTDPKIHPKFEEIDRYELDYTSYITLRLNIAPFTVFYVKVNDDDYFKLYKSIASLIRDNPLKTANNFQEIYIYLVDLYEEQH